MHSRKRKSGFSARRKSRSLATNARNEQYKIKARQNEYYVYLLRSQELIIQLLRSGLMRNNKYSTYQIVARHITSVLPEIHDEPASADDFENVQTLFTIVNNLIYTFPRILKRGNRREIHSAEFKMVQIHNELEDAMESAAKELKANSPKNSEDELSKMMSRLGV
jgi:hypothetical protein